MAFVALATAFTNPYPYTHANCGIEQTITDTPQKVVSMNQAATEFMLAMGLQNNIVGQRADDTIEDPIWPRYAEAYKSIPVTPTSDRRYPTEDQIMALDADFVIGSWNSAFREYEVDAKWSIWSIKHVCASLAEPLPQLGSCASLRRTWRLSRLWAARHPRQGPATEGAARPRMLEQAAFPSRRFHRV